MNHFAPHSLHASVPEGAYPSTQRFTNPGGPEPAPPEDHLRQLIGLLTLLIGALSAHVPALANVLSSTSWVGRDAHTNAHTNVPDQSGALGEAHGDTTTPSLLAVNAQLDQGGLGARTPTPPLANATKVQKQAIKRAALLRELKRVADQRAAGLDPDVKMDFIPFYVCESRANLYKKMGSAFPMPKKRGRSSFWPLSVIDAYKEANHD